ncbi:hypothetical protein PRIPAC_84141, partial [Pristionchus pacificus]|uniref:Ribosomal protein n=1 Tax=Pristionchus pacificus TaxID=54126 RepID=A0A2A6BS51_PRIPA
IYIYICQVNVPDISLVGNIAVKEELFCFVLSIYDNHSLIQVKRFRKASCPIVGRLACSLMMPGRGNGKKLITVRIVKHSFEIIHLLTGECLADEESSNSYAIKKKDELERVAKFNGAAVLLSRHTSKHKPHLSSSSSTSGGPWDGCSFRCYSASPILQIVANERKFADRVLPETCGTS